MQVLIVCSVASERNERVLWERQLLEEVKAAQNEQKTREKRKVDKQLLLVPKVFQFNSTHLIHATQRWVYSHAQLQTLLSHRSCFVERREKKATSLPFSSAFPVPSA